MDIKPSACTSCGEEMDATTMIEEKDRKFTIHEDVEPEPGDFTICVKCGHVMGFCSDLTLRDLTPEEQVKVAGDPRILAIQWARGKR
jgi:hypothetical protein